MESDQMRMESDQMPVLKTSTTVVAQSLSHLVQQKEDLGKAVRSLQRERCEAVQSNGWELRPRQTEIAIDLCACV
jgi:hypothetical protein